MANWVINKIIVKGESIDEVNKFFNDCEKDKNGDYHFGGWIPMPQTFIDYNTEDHPNAKGLTAGKINVFTGETITEEMIEEYRKATVYQMSTYGVVGWIAWGVKNWGTKTDAVMYPSKVDDTTYIILCDTAWSGPTQFMRTIAKRYPNLDFVILSHYEDGGNETVGYVYTDGAGIVFEEDNSENVANMVSDVCQRFVKNDKEWTKTMEQECYDFTAYGMWDITQCYDYFKNDVSEGEIVSEFRNYVERDEVFSKETIDEIFSNQK